MPVALALLVLVLPHGHMAEQLNIEQNQSIAFDQSAPDDVVHDVCMPHCRIEARFCISFHFISLNE